MSSLLKNGWNRVSLGTLSEFRNGVNFSKENFGTGMRVIGVSDFQDNVRASFDNLDEINPEGVVRKEHLLKNGDILFVRSNGNRELIGRNMYVENLSGSVTHSAFSIRLRFMSAECHPRFYAYLFRSQLIRQSLSLQGSGTNISNLNQDILGRLEVPVPPLQVQERIAEILSGYDDLIENNARRIKLLEQAARTLYREWFVNFRFPGHEKVKMVESELGAIPRTWTVSSFTDVADVLSGGTPKTTQPEFWDGEIPFFGPVDAPNEFYVSKTKKSITALGLSRCNSKLYPAETVFITARGTVGKVALPSAPMAMNQSCYALRVKSGYGRLFLFMLTKECVEQLQRKATGAVFDAITVDTFERLRVVLPVPSLTQEFDIVARPIFSLMRNLINKNENLRTTRDMLLPKLVSGEVSVEQIGKEAVAHMV